MPEFPADFPRTRALVEAILRPGGRERPPEERHELFERLHRAGALPLFFSYSRAAGQPLSDSAREHWKTHRARQAVYRREVADVASALGDLRFALLKGEPLARLLFDDGRLRFSSDIDLLVAPADLDRAIDALERAGFALATERGLDPWCNNQVQLDHRTRSSRIDLHWRIAYPYVPAPSTRAMLETLEPLAWGETSIPVLSADRSFVHVCYNFYHDEGTLKALLDAAAWLDRHADGPELDAARRILERHGASALARWPCAVLETLTDLRSLPRFGVSGSLPLRVWTAAVARRFHRRFVALDPPTTLSRLRREIPAVDTFVFSLRVALALTLFEDWTRHPGRLLRPLLLGRHRPGRRLARTLDLPTAPVEYAS